jgi:hypothetical protein
MKADFEFTVTEPHVILNRQKTEAFLRFQTVDSSPRGPQRSGKYIHLQLTPAAAMNLMLMLQAAKKTMGWPDPPGPVQEIAVPPAKDRH